MVLVSEGEAFFGRDGDRFVPTLLCQGPWDPNAAHGGPPSALLARALELHEADSNLHFSRVVVDILRPVPLDPLRIAIATVRRGRKVQLVEAVMTAVDGTELMRARALRVRRVSNDVRDLAPPTEPINFPEPDDSAADDRGGSRPGIAAGVEMRVAVGGFQATGPATYWFRLRAPLVEGEEPSPVQRAVVAADFGNGISQVLGDQFVFINPDLIVHFEREPVGEWIALSATTRIVAGQGGVASGTLHDLSGRFGQSEQSLFIGPRG